MPKDKQTQVSNLIPTTEVAKMLGIHVATVVRRAQAGEIPVAFKVPGETGAYLFDQETIEKLAKAA
jgi:excisionase family DNA binding protein